MATTQLFISHSHQDHELASKLIHVITSFFSVPQDAILCSSVSGYKLGIGTVPSNELRNKLNSTKLVIALLSPNSLMSNWVLFELGAAWMSTIDTLPFLIGNLSNEDLPAALRQNLAGKISDRNDLIDLVAQIQEKLGWEKINDRAGHANIDELIETTINMSFPIIPQEIREELQKSYREKLDELPENQSKILDFIQSRSYLVSQTEIQNNLDFQYMSTMELYFRLENLRMLGFIEKTITGGSLNRPEYSYRTTREYLNSIE